MSETNTTRLPRHVAIIMDGNGRWAKAHNWPSPRGIVRARRDARHHPRKQRYRH
ncbi:MAG: hypothetical protein V8Q82_04440 [Christensenellales bacterium]